MVVLVAAVRRGTDVLVICLVGRAGLKPAPTGWPAGCIDGRVLGVEGRGGLVGVPLAAPGIPRSRRFAGSRPFRCAKGAVGGVGSAVRRGRGVLVVWLVVQVWNLHLRVG